MFSEEIYVEAQSGDCKPPACKTLLSIFLKLKQISRRLFRLPGLRVLRPVARRALAVAEPAGRLSIRTPAVPAWTQANSGITVLSANLWHDWPRYRRIHDRLEEFARLVEENSADIVLLQEVARTSRLWVDWWLAGRLGMGYVYSRANGDEPGIGFEEGLAIFSRFPIRQPHLRQLSCNRNPFVRRLALGARIEAPCGPLLAFSVHLGLVRRGNKAQLAHLLSWVGEVAHGIPAFIGGDFNAGEKEPHIRKLRSKWLDTFRHLNPDADGSTHELIWPWGKPFRRSRLDYIFFKPGKTHWKVIAARHLVTSGSKHSDHLPVLAHLAPV